MTTAPTGDVQSGLLPCPFCGGINAEVCRNENLEFWVECVCGGMRSGRFDEGTAIARWNDRVQPTSHLDHAPQFVADLVALKVTAGELGLFKTMHALEEPVKVVGWEIADAMHTKPGRGQ